MRIKGTAGLLACALVLGAAAYAPARATVSDAQGVSDSAAATTAPAVARLSVIASGTVTIARADGTHVEGRVNAPLLPGDAFSASGDTLAEIQLDGLQSLRLGGGARGSIASNDAHARRIDVRGGVVELAVLRGGDVPTEIVTPAITLSTRYAGDYRVGVDADGTTTLTARSGQADAIVPPKTYTIVAGKTLEARSEGGQTTVTFRAAIVSDAFDDFNASRDRTLTAALGDDTRLPAVLAGYDDLSDYGSWMQDAQYGDLWVPTQAAGWAPYRDGIWSFANDYGWTWVGNEPWGWVPYHYGRWVYLRRVGWCWFPPPTGAMPPWAPGLVGFFGYGGGALGYSGFGWVPLAPYEPYSPWYPSQWYAVGPTPRPPNPPAQPTPGPPKRTHHRPPVKLHPLANSYQNARFGGATTVGATAWHDGSFTRATAADPARLSKVTMLQGRLPMIPPMLKSGPPVTAGAARAAGSPAAPSLQAVPAWQLEFERATNALLAPDIPAPGTHEGAPGLHESSPGLHETLPKLPAMHAAPPVMRASPVMRAGAPSSSGSGSSRGASRPPA